MFFDDHGPPHFHARHADESAKIRIDTLEPIETTLGARTPDELAQVTVDPEIGAIVWPGGADLAPDTLDERLTTAPGQTKPPRRSQRAAAARLSSQRSARA